MTANEHELRKLAVRSPITFRKCMLTGYQINLYLTVKGEGIKGLTTHQLISLQGISPQNASCKLNTLYKKGYLTRKKIDQSSGGFEFLYVVKLNT